MGAPRRYSCLACRAVPLAQPWSIVGGNVLSALIGVTVGMLVPTPRWPAGWRRRWPSPECIFCAACILPAARWPDGDPRRRGCTAKAITFVLTPVLLNS